MSEPRPPILVTGSHRSGTTWAGKMLAACPGVGYIHEPFNIHFNHGVCTARFPQNFTYLCEENEARYLEAVERMLSFRYSLMDGIRRAPSPAQAAGALRSSLRFWWWRTRAFRPLVKDPIAVFSARWFARRFDARVVVLVRHPAAFAASVQRLSWRHPFENLWAQPLLMEHHLSSYAAEIERQVKFGGGDRMDQAALFWSIVYATAQSFAEQDERFVLVRHEDLARAPVEGFEALAKQLRLSYSDEQRRLVAAASSTMNPKSQRGDRHDVRLDSLHTTRAWKSQLSATELTRLRRGVDEVSSRFYSLSDW